jgi:precorrin-2 dehydrogenase/sirohydrochlorin ferrochelatase
MSEEDTPQPYAVLLDVAGRLTVVVGAGPRAERAAKALATHGADVVVIAPIIPIELLRMESDGILTVENRAYAPGDLEGAFLVVAASGSKDTDAAVAKEARERRVLLNVPSDAAASDFIVPSVVRRGGLQIAVSTGGSAPAATREVRRIISDEFGWEWAVYVELLGEVRALAARRTGLGDAQLAPLFAAIAASDARDRLRDGEEITAAELYEAHAAVIAPAADTEGTGE